MSTNRERATDRNIADYILRCKGQITTLELQKLVCIAQGWSLAIRDRPLFSDRVEAWRDGPVAVSLYQAHRKQMHVRAGEIPQGDANKVSQEDRSFIDRIIAAFRDFAPASLRSLLHEEKPWIDAWGDRPEDGHGSDEITQEAMRDYYSRLPSPEIVADDYIVSKRYARTLARLSE